MRTGTRRQLDPDLRIANAGGGSLSLEGGAFGGPYEFDLKGGCHALPEGRGLFEYVIKRADRVTGRGTITVSADGRWLTELSWAVDHPDRKSRLVYKRD